MEKQYKRFEELFNSFICGNITHYKITLKKMQKKTIAKYIQWAEEMGIDVNNLRLDYLYNF